MNTAHSYEFIDGYFEFILIEVKSNKIDFFQFTERCKIYATPMHVPCLKLITREAPKFTSHFNIHKKHSTYKVQVDTILVGLPIRYTSLHNKTHSFSGF